jgi:hypothetical protein
VYKRFGIRPNHLGLIDKLDDAQQVNEYLLQTGAEPAIWEPWLLLDYTPKRYKSNCCDRAFTPTTWSMSVVAIFHQLGDLTVYLVK